MTEKNERPEGAHDDPEHEQLHECIEECLNCHVVCTLTAQHCLVKGGSHGEIDLVGVLLDCAEMCQTAANFMLRGSPYHVITCAAAAEVARACEEACRGVEDEQLSHCADVCGACAALCEEMATMEESE